MIDGSWKWSTCFDNNGDVVVDNYLFICDRSNKHNTSIKCDVDGAGNPNTEHGYYMLLNGQDLVILHTKNLKTGIKLDPQDGEKWPVELGRSIKYKKKDLIILVCQF